MSYKTDYGRVLGMGSAKHGSEHFWTQRLTAVALAILTPFFILPFAANLGQSFEAVQASYAKPFNAIVAALFVVIAFYHLCLGLQTVIEDYIHHKGWRTGLLLANSGFCLVFGFTGLFAIAKIAFSA